MLLGVSLIFKWEVDKYFCLVIVFVLLSINVILYLLDFWWKYVVVCLVLIIKFMLLFGFRVILFLVKEIDVVFVIIIEVKRVMIGMILNCFMEIFF